jgi:hypothetical protein
MTTPINTYRPDTPNNDYIHGAKTKLQWQPPGSSPTPPAVDLLVESISFDDNVDTDDISHTGGNGWKLRLDGLEEITGQIVYVWDAFNIPYDATLMPFKPRTYATLILKPDGVTSMTIPVLLSGVSFSGGPKAGTLRVTSKYESSGHPTMPTASQTTPTSPLS